MATRDYFAQFGTGNPSSNSGLLPTFITFITTTGANGTPPAITEPGTKGIYKFSYDASATMIAFVLDGFTTGLATADRYIVGVLDPYDTFGVTLNAIGLTAIGQGNTLVSIGNTLTAQGVLINSVGTILVNQGSTLVAIGNTAIATETNQGLTLVAIGNTLSVLGSGIGTAADTIGTTVVNPTTLFGFLRRAQELAEGNNVYTKATGVLTLSSRANTLIASKTVSDTSVQTTKA